MPNSFLAGWATCFVVMQLLINHADNACVKRGGVFIHGICQVACVDAKSPPARGRG